MWMEVRRRPPTARAGKVRELRGRVRTRLRRRAKADHVVRARGGGGQYHGAHLAWTRPPYRDSQGRGSLSRSRTTVPSCSKWLPAQSCAAGESSSVWPPIVSVRSAEAGRRSPRLPSSTLTLGRLSCGHDDAMTLFVTRVLGAPSRRSGRSTRATAMRYAASDQVEGCYR